MNRTSAVRKTKMFMQGEQIQYKFSFPGKFKSRKLMFLVAQRKIELK